MEIERLKLTRGTKVPNEGGCTNFGGIALATSKKLYAIKTRQDNSVSTIYSFLDYREQSYTKRTYTGKLGHGNGLAFGDGLLAVAPCGNYLTIIDTKTLKRTEYKSCKYISAVAYKGAGVWLVRSKGDIYKVQASGDMVKILGRYKLNNPMASEGFVVTQDITYKRGKLYCVYSNKQKTQNCIIVNLLNGKTTGQLEVEKVYISGKSDTLYEWESVAVKANGDIIIAANTADGDYLYTAEI